MDNTERALLLELAKFFTADQEKLAALLPAGATPALLGHLLWSRTGGIALEVLQRHGLLDAVPPELRHSLQSIYLYSIARNRRFFRELKALSTVLEARDYRYALLGDAWLCGFYPRGCRTCDKLELLVDPKDFYSICEALLCRGFRPTAAPSNAPWQNACGGHICLEPPCKQAEPDEAHAPVPDLRHPNIELYSSPRAMGFAKEAQEELLIEAKTRQMTEDLHIRTLGRSDFFIALCAELYQKATAPQDTKAEKRLWLDRLCDIYMHLYIFSQAYIDRVFQRAEQLGLVPSCACAILWTEQLLPSKNPYAIARAREQLAGKELPLPDIGTDLWC